MEPTKLAHTAYAPSAPPDAYDDADSLPMARPVAYYDVRPPRDPHVPLLPVHHPPQPTSFSGGVALFLTNSGRLAIFHVLNFMLGLVAFYTVVFGLLLSVVLLPLCCFGIVGFRMLLALAGDFVRADVALHNWIVAPDQRFSVPQSNGHNYWVTFADPRASPSECPSTHRPVAKLLYFLTLKFLIAVHLSTISVAFTFAFPIATFSIADMRATFFSNVFSVFGFVMLTLFLLILGTAFMKFSAMLSCLITRFVCKEDDSFTDFSNHAMGYPVAAPTYGAVHPQAAEPKDERVLV